MVPIGTWLYTSVFGKHIGTDMFGNRYFTRMIMRDGHPYEKRWVLYKGTPEPSKVPPSWHGWLHHMHNNIPEAADEKPAYQWQQAHQVNVTGTEFAYRPDGHVTQGGDRAKATGDYQAWSPE
jgi:NADH:ubiquinone oxidoreductase subunit